MSNIINPNKLCWECKHIYFSPGDRGYSEYTPGYDMTLECTKTYWKFNPLGDGLNSLRQCLTYAEHCSSFEESK